MDSLIPESRQSRQTFAGPDGQGLIVCDSAVPSDRVRYDAAQQVWSQRYGYTSWVGHYRDAVPTPDDLQRSETVDGDAVTLLDGQRWTIAKLREWRDADPSVTYECRLPRVMTQDPQSGEYVLSRVVPRYREIWDDSLRVAESLFEQLGESNRAEMPYRDFVAYAVQLLAINYRVDASVVSHLELLSPDLADDVVLASLDWDTLRAHLKNRLSRRESGGTPSEPGATRPAGD